ncbi:WD40 repeat domain-containing protein [Solirubrobacter ginsenosidimutans]|uniref:WD40 repeat domain-containing protein n=1 Tax=Solirubrobacter ginsenosidimutans TaxID=490573 RepID=A0A9X3N1F7_9ACTN|nr:WD40 repeat domain-containing protein [Solirubrobacter ginsenosidimutans]MDA0166714.1 WD40 repeat domain-containing protein [Solirubrobacter ginsenosidimutans]
MFRLGCVVTALVFMVAAPAKAQLRAVADGPTPVLFGDRVLWGTQSDGVMQFASAPLSGGPAVPFGDVPIRNRDALWLAASPAQVAVQLRSLDSPSAPGRLYAAGADGVFRELAGDVGEEPFDPLWPPLSVTTEGVFTQEATPTLRSVAGAKTEVVLPPEGDPGFVAAAGGVGVASTDGVLIVFDLRSGTELHQISLGSFDAQVTSLAVSPEGGVAATTATGDGSDVVLWAPAGARQVRVLATPARAEEVATAGGRVAFVGSNRLDGGVRVAVLDGATGTGLFRGPITAEAGGLSFDGAHIAYRTEACTLVSDVTAASSTSVVPAGACVRTAATVASLARAGAYARVDVACLSAPGDTCRVATRLGSARATARIPAGRTRILRLRGRGAKISVRVTDPDGRSRAVSGD